MKQRLLFLVCMMFGSHASGSVNNAQDGKVSGIIVLAYLAQTINILGQPLSSHRTSTPEKPIVQKQRNSHDQSKQTSHARNNSMRKRIIQQPCKIQKASHVRYKTL
jgi:hypothetical protein